MLLLAMANMYATLTRWRQAAGWVIRLAHITSRQQTDRDAQRPLFRQAALAGQNCRSISGPLISPPDLQHHFVPGKAPDSLLQATRSQVRDPPVLTRYEKERTISTAPQDFTVVVMVCGTSDRLAECHALPSG